ncbi:MAG TPA: hypothetical protein VMW66_06200 [Elusimicrobiales bacterium]|nr:hypothetical protein [Elusimicrobiales bacterium]
MSILKQAIIEIVGALFNRTVQITKDGFIIVKGLVQLINGEQYKISTLYLTGTMDAGTQTLVPHGIIDADHILSINADIKHNTLDCWCVEEYKLTPTTSNGYSVMYTDINIIFENVGISFRGQPYKIAITYIVD